jgi:hypothetical protein
VTTYAILLGITAIVIFAAGIFSFSEGGVEDLAFMVFAAVVAALCFVIARGLWLLRNWARIAVIVLQGLSVLGNLFQIPNSSSGLSLIREALGLAIGAYILYWFASHGEYFS